ncbi:DNA mismatch repair endonuclease MutL [bacterium]|nr:DNA mismatch repair endonuclease MutL [bacterium]
MGKIELLPEQLINKIAAGEVVERPLSVVKELIENSIDANASEITIELKKGGKALIKIRDDGDGMEESDIFLALERYATSKMVDLSDLKSIKTLGFRGEALPSIAAVSRMKVASATTHGEGYFIEYADSILRKNGATPMAKGTEITVANLFFNIPVRRKFLKSDDRELALVREMIQKIAVQYPHIAFTLIHNERKLFFYPQSSSKEQRLLTVWHVSKEAIATQSDDENNEQISVSVGTPFATFSGPSIVAVNGRIINDRRINGVVYRTFRETVGGAFSAPFALFLQLNPTSLDVNVHPTKLEVRFVDEKKLFVRIERLLKEALHSFRESAPIPPTVGTDLRVRSSGNGQPSEYGQTQRSNPTYIREQTPLWNNETEGEDFKTIFKNYAVHGTVFGLYIVVEMENTLYLIDQHASHERITFNKMKELVKRKSGLSQMFITPSVLQLSPEEMVLLSENSELFDNLGFILEPFDEKTALLRGVPALGMEVEWTQLVKEMFGELKRDGDISAFNEEFLGFVATRACHASVRNNDALNDGQIEALLKDINISNALTCPHGRPFFFKITKDEIEKQVKRR